MRKPAGQVTRQIKGCKRFLLNVFAYQMFAYQIPFKNYVNSLGGRGDCPKNDKVLHRRRGPRLKGDVNPRKKILFRQSDWNYPINCNDTTLSTFCVENMQISRNYDFLNFTEGRLIFSSKSVTFLDVTREVQAKCDMVRRGSNFLNFWVTYFLNDP